jgi:hypothetical protein
LAADEITTSLKDRKIDLQVFVSNLSTSLRKDHQLRICFADLTRPGICSRRSRQQVGTYHLGEAAERTSRERAEYLAFHFSNHALFSDDEHLRYGNTTMRQLQ